MAAALAVAWLSAGREVGAVWMPAPVSGGNYSGEYIAFSAPAREPVTTTAGGQ